MKMKSTPFLETDSIGNPQVISHAVIAVSCVGKYSVELKKSGDKWD